MEPSPVFLSWWELIPLVLLRPLSALFFVLSILSFGWFLAWKLVLVHVPLVQEIFGLRKKEKKPKPPTHRRFSQIYNSMDARNRASLCKLKVEWEAQIIILVIMNLLSVQITLYPFMPILTATFHGC